MDKMNIKKYGLLFAASIVLATVACNKIGETDTDINQNDEVILTEKLTLEIDTKVTLSDALEAAWEDGDKIAVWTGTSEDSGEFQSCEVSSNSITVAFADESYHRYNYAVYYSGAVLPSYADGLLSVNLPSEYAYAQVSGTKNPVPMVSKSSSSEGTTLSFHAVGALARITLNGIPASTKYVKVAFDKDVTGNFAVSDVATGTPYITASEATDKNIVTIVLPDYTTNYTRYINAPINIPVPQGTVSVTAVTAYDSNEKLLATNLGGSLIKDWNARRAHAKKATASFTPSFHDLIVAPGNLYTENGEMKMSETAYLHFYNGVHDTYTDNEGGYSAANRTFFLWNELYVMMGTGSLPTYQQATTNQTGTDMSTMTQSFGGKSWHIGSSDEYKMLFGQAGNPQRPGAYISFTTKGGNPKTKDGTRWTKVTLTDYDGETIGAGSSDADKEVKLRGIILFPDNRSITMDFEAYGGNLDNSSAKFEVKTITIETLNDLIQNQGCAFLPAGGFYYITNKTHMNWHLSVDFASGTDNATKFDRFNLQNTAMSYGVSTDKTLHAHSVRLLRPVE